MTIRVVHISTQDQQGGAARSAYRLHAGLRELGCDSQLLVGTRDGSDPFVRLFQPPRDSVSRLMRYARRKNIAASFRRYRRTRPAGLEFFSDDRSEFQSAILEQIPDCDILHLHWVAGLFDYRAFLPAAACKAPVIWTLHDMNAFTGGCHYDRECGRYAEACGACPQLGSKEEADLSRAVWRRKREAFGAIPQGRLHVVAPSQWLARQASRSSLLGAMPVSVIPYGLDTQAFGPRDANLARNVLEIPQDARVLFFSAHWLGEQRKGFALLAEVLADMTNVSNLYLLTAGKVAGAAPVSIPHRHLGIVESEQLLSLAYSAADVFVLPSLQDNLPNTLLESLSCGTPVAAFDVGGVPDVIGNPMEEGFVGLLARPADVPDLRRVIIELLGHPGLRTTVRQSCRLRALQRYTLTASARHYINLYASLHDGHGLSMTAEETKCPQSQSAPTLR